MPGLALTLLGSTTVLWAEQPLRQFRATKVQALLIYLVMNASRPQQRETLLDLLWPGSPQDLAQSSLRQTLYRLRQAIPDCVTRDGADTAPFLLADRQTVQVNPVVIYDLDVDRFTQLLAESEIGDADQQKQCLQTAVALNQGDFLTDFYLPDSAVFEEWAAAVREQLRRQMLAALARLADIHMGDGVFAEAEACVRRQLALDNLRESAHRQLMELLARSRRRRAALSHYETYRQLLQDELSIEPSAETEALVEAIRADEWGRGVGVGKRPEVGSPMPPHSPEPPHNLPAPTTPFIGRQMELHLLDEWLAQSGAPLITLTGPGGIGKTRLALAWASQQVTAVTNNVPRFADGVFFVPLAGLDAAVHIVPALAEALNFPLQGQSVQEPRSPQQQLLDYLRQKQMLIVLDNFEQLLEGVGLLTDILQAAPQVQLVVTSRDRLRLHNEQRFPVEGLSFPDELPDGEMPVEAALSYTAVQLFLQAGRRVQPNFILTPENLPPILHLCRQLSGIPLALELAASWLDTFPIENIVAEIQQSLDFLAADWQDMLPRHRSFRAAIDTSWQKLAADERDIFTQLSVFRGGFTLPAAQAVVTMLDERALLSRVLARLVNKSLLSFDHHENRYQMHELLRQYAAEKLTNNQSQVRKRHALYFVGFLHRCDPGLKGAKEQEMLALVEADIKNIQTGWQWLVQHGHAEALLNAADSMGIFYDLRGRYTEGSHAFQAVTEKWRITEPDDTVLTSQRLLVRALAWQTVFTSDIATTVTQLEQSLGLLPDSPDVMPERAFTLLHLGNVTRHTDLERAKQLYMQALAYYRQVNDPWGIAMTLRELGWWHFQCNLLAESKSFYREVLTISEAIGSDRGLIWAYNGLAWCAVVAGDRETAATVADQLVAILPKSEMSLLLSEEIWAAVFRLEGRFDEAARHFDRVIHICQKLGLLINVAVLTLLSGGNDLHLGEYAQAEQKIETARLNLHQASAGTHWRIPLCYHFQGMISLARQEYASAEEHLQQALIIHRRDQVQGNTAGALALLALAKCGLGEYAAAAQALDESWPLIIETHNFIAALEGLMGTARLMAEQHQEALAVELYALAMRYPFVANSRLYDDLAGRYIRAHTTHLPPDTYQAAWQRGQARDLWRTAEMLSADLGYLQESSVIVQ